MAGETLPTPFGGGAVRRLFKEQCQWRAGSAHTCSVVRRLRRTKARFTRSQRGKAAQKAAPLGAAFVLGREWGAAPPTIAHCSLLIDALLIEKGVRNARLPRAGVGGKPTRHSSPFTLPYPL